MKKLLLLLMAFCFIQLGFAQKTENIPTEAEWRNYLHSRLSGIQTKLYNLALQGKVNAYTNDSFKTVYSLEHLKYRGSNKYQKYINGIDDNADSTYRPFSPNKIQTIWFKQKTNTAAFDIHQQRELTGIALIYQPSYRLGLLSMPHPLLNIRINDLKTFLTIDEFSFISLLYYYSLQCNTLNMVNIMADEDPFYFYNTYPSSSYVIDSIFIDKIVYMQLNSGGFINDQLYNNPLEKIILDHQTEELISNSEFNRKYYGSRKTRIVTGIVNNQQVLKDTIIQEPYPMYFISSIEMKGANAMGFNFDIVPENKVSLKFSISLQALKDKKIAPTYVWFYEDYFRWKL